MSIVHLKHDQINKSKWDECILKSENGLIYANSWYLDVVSPGWEALVLHDYESVFPLPVKRKLGIPYISHPIFAQQLGLFSLKYREDEINEFIKSIPKKYIKVLLRINHSCNTSKYKLSERLNFILNIKGERNNQESFNQNTRRNIKKFTNSGFSITGKLLVSDFMKLKKSTSRASLTQQEWDRLELLINEIITHDCGSFKAVYDSETLISAVLFTKWKDRICYLFSASSPKGMEVRASFGIVNDVICAFSVNNYLLDFEGSMDENVSRFFKGFGAIPETYYEFKRSI